MTGEWTTSRRNILQGGGAAIASALAGCYAAEDDSSKDVIGAIPVSAMTEQEFITVAQSIDDLDEPAQTPAIAYTLDDGWVEFTQ